MASFPHENSSNDIHQSTSFHVNQWPSNFGASAVYFFNKPIAEPVRILCLANGIIARWHQAMRQQITYVMSTFDAQIHNPPTSPIRTSNKLWGYNFKTRKPSYIIGIFLVPWWNNIKIEDVILNLIRRSDVWKLDILSSEEMMDEFVRKDKMRYSMHWICCICSFVWLLWLLCVE